MSYTTFFAQADSANMVVENAKFKKPNNFDNRLSEVTKRIEELNMRAKTASTPMGGMGGMETGHYNMYQ